MNTEKDRRSFTQRQKLEKARSAESWVSDKLKQKGWHILARNWIQKGCEIDIIAKKEDSLLFIEVKYRRKLEDPALLLSRQKILALRYGIHRYRQLGAVEATTFFAYLALVYPCESSFKSKWWPLEIF